LIRTQFAAQCNFTKKGLVDSANAVRKIVEFSDRIDSQRGAANTTVDTSHPVVNEFLSALADNLNISAALAVVHGWIGSRIEDAAEAAGVMQVIDSVLGVVQLTKSGSVAAQADEEDQEISLLCRLIDEARSRKDFSAADLHRKELTQRGYEVRSTAEGTVAKRKMA
jgi:cysteinyl-tRNA synthetase